jgi:ribosomal protein L16 Arg81 hydroxylase
VIWSVARLIEPVSREEFFAAYFERKPLVVRRNQAHYFDGLLTPDDVDRVITTYALHHPSVSVVSAARKIGVEEYVYPSGLIDAARIYQHFADGATIILQNLEVHWPSMATLCRALEAETSTRFQTNIYFTPDRAQGFPTHYDSHDVFVLQVEGKKHWLLYDTPIELPYRGQGFDPSRFAPGNITMEFDLEPGDMAYVPRGVMHDASTHRDGGQSLHVTLGWMSRSWTDLLVEAVAQVGIADPAFRKALPIGFTHESFDRVPARAYMKELFARVAERADFDAALDHFIDDLVSTRHPLIRGQLEQVQRLPALTLDTPLARTPSLVWRLGRKGEETILISAYGGHLALPSHTEPAVRHALGSDAFTARELPGDLDDEGKLVLVRRLAREALIRIR